MIFLACLLLAACAMPVIYFLRSHTGAFLAIFSLEFAGWYAIPILLMHRVQIGQLPAHDLPIPLVIMALELALAGFLCLCLGYYLVPKGASFIPRFEMAWSSPGVLRVAAFALCFVGLIGTALLHRGSRDTGNPSQFVALAATLVLYGIALLFTLQLMRQLNPLYLIALWGVFVPARVLLGLSSAAAASVLGVGLLLLLLYSELRGRLWWSALIIGAISVTVLRPLMTPFRGLTWEGGKESNLSTVRKLEVFGRIASGAAQGRFGGYDQMVQFAARRLCVTCTFADVIHQTPGIVPYWGGATYYPILLKPIPRFMWPNKPTDDSGQAFGHRYGLLPRGDHETTYNLPQTVELYANFGVMGVIVGSFLFGIMYRSVELMFFHARSGVGAVAVGSVITCQLLSIESGASLVIGGFIVSMISLPLVLLVIDAADLWSASTRWSAAS